MKIDWQAYEDGLLGPEERELAEKALRTDPSARKQLEGLRAFRAMLRNVALREPVPHRRLRTILRSVIGRSRPALRRYALVGAATVAAVVFAFLSFRAIYQPPVGEMRESFDTFAQAQTWASRQTGFVIPKIELASLGAFQSVHCSSGEACFDYLVNGHILHVAISRVKIDPTHCGLQVIEGKPMYVDKLGDAISFESSDGSTVTVEGCSKELRLQAAGILYAQLHP